MVSFIGWKYKKYFDLASGKEELYNDEIKNIKVRCRVCFPAQKILSTSKNTTSNLLKHLRVMHSFIDLGDDPVPRQRLTVNQSHDVKVADKPLSAIILDLLLDYVTEDMKPLSAIESPAFQKLVNGLVGKQTKIPCRKSIVNAIEKRFEKTNKILNAILKPAKYVCTTADIWGANNKSFLGVTAHWICENSLKRAEAAIYCSRLNGGHTFNEISAVLSDVNCKFELTDKITTIVTDNVSNFIKAFRVFQSTEFEEYDDTQCEFIDIGEVMKTVNDGDPHALPPSRKCSSHTLNLISKDIDKAMRLENADLYVGAMEKCSVLWNRASQSSRASDLIEDIAKVRLIETAVTRWSSEFKAVKNISQIDFELLCNICQQLNTMMLTVEEVSILKKFVEVAEPLAQALDILHSENYCFYGSLLPILYTLKRKLENVKRNPILTDVADFVIKWIDKRFSDDFKDRDALLAAVSHPNFKNCFLESLEDREKLRELLLAEMRMMYNNPPEKMEQKPEIDNSGFFDFITSTHQTSSYELELFEYFRSCKSVEELNQYPTIKAIFIKYNTTILSSAPVEKLFNLDGNIIIPRKNQADDHFEQLLFLRYNKHLK